MTSCLPPLSDCDWPVEILELRDGFAGQLNVYRTMAHNPALLRAWAPLRQYIVKDNHLGPMRSEVVILRAAHRMGSAYEWAHHVSRGRAVGLEDERIRALAGVPGSEDALIVAAVDALIDHHRLSEALEAELCEALGQAAVLDLMAIVGFYSVLGFVLMTYATPIDDTVRAELMAQPL